jgi:SAM-dependent methyltransferase
VVTDPSSVRLRRRGAALLHQAGAILQVAGQRLRPAGDPDLAGDRWVEWSFCMARMSDGPGRTLDFGADVGFLSLAAAQRGHDVVALDRLPSSLQYEHERVQAVCADILDDPLRGETFDQIVNCSSVEHVGLGGRYGSTAQTDGDLRAMATLSRLLAAEGRMLLTIPVGLDAVCAPLHRVYGEERLPRLLDGFAAVEEQYWAKQNRAWRQVPRETALAVPGSEREYALGLLVLTAA